jgi:hypothetical protein
MGNRRMLERAGNVLRHGQRISTCRSRNFT